AESIASHCVIAQSILNCRDSQSCGIAHGQQNNPCYTMRRWSNRSDLRRSDTGYGCCKSIHRYYGIGPEADAANHDWATVQGKARRHHTISVEQPSAIEIIGPSIAAAVSHTQRYGAWSNSGDRQSC